MEPWKPRPHSFTVSQSHSLTHSLQPQKTDIAPSRGNYVQREKEAGMGRGRRSLGQTCFGSSWLVLAVLAHPPGRRTPPHTRCSPHSLFTSKLPSLDKSLAKSSLSSDGVLTALGSFPRGPRPITCHDEPTFLGLGYAMI